MPHNRGGSHEQQAKPGQTSHKSAGGNPDQGNQSGSRSNQGGSHEQHVKAGQQSHKNS